MAWRDSRQRQTLKTSYLLKEKKTEGKALPSPLNLKDHLPSVAAAVIAFAGCTAGWNRLLTPPPQQPIQAQLLSSCISINTITEASPDSNIPKEPKR